MKETIENTDQTNITALNHEGVLKSKSVLQGIFYGLVPHIGCIAFIIFSVLGVTTATIFFKQLLLNPYFFYILIGLSIAFATLSAVLYLKRQGFLVFSKNSNSFEVSFIHGWFRRKWKYLATLYGTTIGVNLLLFIIIFPLLANISTASITSNIASGNNLSLLKLQVDIPCSGHAPLITSELKSIEGVVSVQFNFPNIFDVKYDTTKTTKEKILSLEVFKTYKATLLSYSESQNTQQLSTQLSDNQTNSQPNTASGSCCGSNGCGSSAGGCGCGRR